MPEVVIELEAGEEIIGEVGKRTWVKGPIETKTKISGGIGKAL